jgi:glycosyltransferase involved in cell wall biosynthesis
MPYFSVIVPTYNQAGFLPQALDSILAQIDPDWEAVVVNDGSTDETAQVLADYAARDARFVIVHKENGGVGSALNAGLRQARGEWVCWLSSDDLFEPDKLSLNRRWIAQQPAGRFFYSYFSTRHEETGMIEKGRLWGTELPAPEWQVLGLLHHNYVSGITICIHRESWVETGFFNEALHYGQDYDMWLRLISRYPAVFIPEWTCVSRYHAAQGSGLFLEACMYDSAKSAADFINANVFENYFPMLDLSEYKSAMRAARETLRIAAAPDAFLYRLGPHAGLVLRLLDWAERAMPASRLWSHCRRWIRKQVRKYPFAPESLYWKLANAVAELKDGRPAFSPIPVVSLAVNRYHRDRAAGNPAADSLHVYLDRFENVIPPERSVALPQHEVVLYIQPELFIEDEDPVLSACLEAGAALAQAGAQVLLVGRSDRLTGYLEGIPYLGLPNGCDHHRALACLQPFDTLISVGYSGSLRNLAARQMLTFTTQTVREEKFSEQVLEAVRSSTAPAPMPLVMRLIILWGRMERQIEDEIPARLGRFRLRIENAVRWRLQSLRRWWDRRP